MTDAPGPKRNSNTAFTGKSGKGKGWYLGYHAEQSNKPRVIWDKKGEHADLSGHVLQLTKQRWLAMQAKGAKTVWQDVLARFPSLRIHTHGLTPAELQGAAASCAEVVHERGRMLWVASEYHLIAPNKGSGLGVCPGEILVLHTDARTCQVDILFDTQRPALVDTTVMSQCNRRAGFGMDDENDLKRYARSFSPVPRADLQAAGIPVPAGKADVVQPKDFMAYMPPFRCLHLDCDTSQQVIIDTSKLTRRTTHQG